MMNTNQILGSEMVILYDSSVLAYATDFDLTVDKNVIEVTTLASDGWKEFKVDMKEWSVSCSGAVTVTDASGLIDYDALMYDIKNNDIAITVAIKPDITSNKYEEGSAYIKSIKETGSVGDKMTFSVEFQGTGSLTTKTVV